ncbi:hypothetical protein [Colwellia sp. Arc7-D]|uniref:hypothetical protein n=1 Tax=Colwellia sp. Arc7-D TaxID=2161872 RepID=UPI000D3529AF|nr:hypothetical protein [Colwellia sp. Arc7-D]AWB56234.1 hypothetical protein DBO93_00720 [Colwellia sp. Arc7-D]
MDSSPWGEVARNYSIIYVVNVNGIKREFAILLPVDTRYKKDFATAKTDSFFNRAPTFASSRCTRVTVGQNDKPNDDILCLNYKFNSGSIHYDTALGAKKLKRKTKKPLLFNIPLGDDIIVDTYFEIREVSTQESVFTKRFH